MATNTTTQTEAHRDADINHDESATVSVTTSPEVEDRAMIEVYLPVEEADERIVADTDDRVGEPSRLRIVTGWDTVHNVEDAAEKAFAAVTGEKRDLDLGDAMCVERLDGGDSEMATFVAHRRID